MDELLSGRLLQYLSFADYTWCTSTDAFALPYWEKGWGGRVLASQPVDSIYSIMKREH